MGYVAAACRCEGASPCLGWLQASVGPYQDVTNSLQAFVSWLPSLHQIEGGAAYPVKACGTHNAYDPALPQPVGVLEAQRMTFN